MKLTLAPGKIAVRKIEAKLKGGLALPVNRQKAYDIAQITCVGDLTAYGYKREESTKEGFKEGDLVLFQLPAHLAQTTSHTIKGVLNLILNVGDIVARLTNPLDKENSVMVDLAGFKIAGRFILLKPSIRKTEGSTIIIPDAAHEAQRESIHYSVLQTGPDVTVELTKGMEVFPNKGRVNPMTVDNEEVCFVDQANIDGVLTE